MSDIWQYYTPNTTDQEAYSQFELRYGYKPLLLRRDASAVGVGPIGKRQYAAGDKITRNGQSYTVVEVEKTLAGYTILATNEGGESEILEI